MDELLNLCFRLGVMAGRRESLSLVEDTVSQTVVLREVVETLSQKFADLPRRC